MERKKLKDIAASLKKGTLKQTELVDDGQFCVVNGGASFYGHYNESNNAGNAFCVSARGTAGYVTYMTEAFWAGGLCYPYRSANEDEIKTKYIYYALKNKQKEIIAKYVVHEGGTPALNKCDLDEYLVPVPPLEIQNEIVRVLDKMEALCSDITKGLPAEIEARQKQYEYYRDKLLTFDVKESA